MPGALNQLVGSHQLIPATWTLNINLRALVLFYVVSRYIRNCTVCSDPFVVRFSQLGELNSSLGALEPKCTLEVIYLTHIGSLGKVIE